MEVNSSSWVVLKFGGTSVSTKNRWKVISTRTQELLEKNHRVWIVVSALTQVTNRLQQAIQEAISGINHLSSYFFILEQHLNLAVECDLLTSSQIQLILKDFQTIGSCQQPNLDKFQRFFQLFYELHRILEGIRLTEETSPRLRARISSYGELLSSQLGLLVLQQFKIHSIKVVDARDVLCTSKMSHFCSIRKSSMDSATKSSSSSTVMTHPQKENQLSKSMLLAEEDRYLEASITLPMIVPKPTEKPFISVFEASEDKSVILTQGFIARNAHGETCLLGRGGSDTSASLFAGLLQANCLEIWTDVSGMYTSDPRDVKNANLIHRLCYREAQELAAMGAKVLHPKCIAPVQYANVPVEIRNTQDPHAERTTISHGKEMNKAEIIAVVRRNEMTLLTLTAFDMCGHSGFLSQFFLPFEQLGISVDLIATSQFSVSVTLDHIPGTVKGEIFHRLLAQLQPLGEVSIRHPCAVVSIVGRKLRQSLNSIGNVLTLLSGKDVYLLSESAEDLNLSVVVDQSEAQDIVQTMHERLFSSKESN